MSRRRPAAGIAAALLAAALRPGLPADDAPSRIVVLGGQETAAGRDVIAGFRKSIGEGPGRPKIELLQSGSGDQADLESVLKQALQRPASLIFALGSVATRAAVRQVPASPILSGLILNSRALAGTTHATGVVLEFPVETEFRWMRQFLPAQEDVAVLYNPAENAARIAEAEDAARRLGWTLRARKVESALDVPDAIAELARTAAVIWGVPDALVLNAHTARPILLIAMRERTPFVGLSSNWVKAGALYALDRDYVDIGVQCGEMAAQILSGTPPASIPPAPPRQVVYSVNLKTARYLKIDLPEALVRGARDLIDD